MKLAHRRQFLHLAAGTAALPALSRVAGAQPYPSRPVTIIVPFTAGRVGFFLIQCHEIECPGCDVFRIPLWL